ncbi:MAG: transporter [Halobacteriaceae archaeon]
MAIGTTISYIVHLLVAAIWTGSVVFVAVGVIPTARMDGVGEAALRGALNRLTTISRGGSVLLLLTGGHLAAAQYTVDTLTGTTRGYLVVGMIVLWVLLTGLVEVGASKIIGSGKAAEGRPYILASGALAVLLLIDAGLLLS